MADLSQIDEAIRGILVADATFIADLGAATNVFQGKSINTVTTPPVVKFFSLYQNPNVQLSGYGDFDDRWQIDFIGPDPTVLKRLIERADALLCIPYRRSTYITTDNYKVRRMMRRNALGPIGTGAEYEGREIQQISCEYDLKITLHTPE